MNSCFRSIALTALILAPTSSAFSLPARLTVDTRSSRLNVATTPDFDVQQGDEKDKINIKVEKIDENYGAMTDLSGIAFSVSLPSATVLVILVVICRSS